MGQYYYIVNIDKKQYLHPHRFGDGLKAVEFASGYNTMRALAYLLTKSDGGGGGDYKDDPSGIAGSWAGDRIWIVGDYNSNKLYDVAHDEYTEMSEVVIPLLRENHMFVEGGVFGDARPMLHPDVLIVR